MRYNKTFLKLFILYSGLLVISQSAMCQSLILPSVYSDHMVLQRDTTLIVGKAQSYSSIKVLINNVSKITKADREGHWRVEIQGLKAGGPYQLKITTSNNEEKIFNNVLIGDVWLASGQSNMEWSPREGINGWEEEKLQANHPYIRLFDVSRNPQGNSVWDLKDHNWVNCTPENLESFSSVAYFFAKNIHSKRKIPIGIINSSFGGSRIEAWLSYKALKVSGVPHDSILSDEEFENLKIEYDIDNALREEIFEKVNVGKRLGVHLKTFDDSSWKKIFVPQDWKDNELKGSGYVWMRKRFVIEKKKTLGDTCKIYFGKIMHGHETYLNGEKLEDKGNYFDKNSHFLVPTSNLVEGENVLAVRLIRYWGDSGGFVEDKDSFGIISITDSSMLISLAGIWKYNNNIEPKFNDLQWFHHKPTLLHNGMIAPLTNLKIKGFLWYQGESNSHNAEVYDDLLKAMIKGWRENFEIPNGPFFIVQLPNYKDVNPQPVDSRWARVREAQSKAAELDNTFLVPIIDLGESENIHPKNKKDVGKRIANVALKYVYGDIEAPLGPELENIEYCKNKISLSFSNVGAGLIISDNKPIRGFSIADDNGKFHWAKAKIIGKNKIEVYAPFVNRPSKLRYAWQDNPNVNLFNSLGLPVEPFRTDDMDFEYID